MMTGESPLRDENLHKLRFACSCASAADVADDPWSTVSKQGKLNDGSKELILNAVYLRPRTIAQLAQLLTLSQPTVHRHIREMLASDLVREVDVGDEERGWAVERYYRPNFPVVLASHRREFLPAIEEIAHEFAEDFRDRLASLSEVFSRIDSPDPQARFEDLLHYLYTTAVRMARNRLEEEGALPPWPVHPDGSRWIWWAEEPLQQEEA